MSNDLKWYIIQVVSNHEQKVKDNLENRIFTDGSSEIQEIYLPYAIHETKTGKLIRKPMFPGYLYVKLIMSDQSWYIIRNTEYVTGIVGSSGQRTKPTPISEEQIEKIREKEIEELQIKKNISKISNQEKIVTKLNYEIGDFVQIIQGEFKGKMAKVTEILLMKQVLKIEIEMFGRVIKVEMPLSFVKKVE